MAERYPYSYANRLVLYAFTAEIFRRLFERKVKIVVI